MPNFKVSASRLKTTSTSQSAITSKLAGSPTYQGWEFGLYQGKPYLFIANNYGTGNDLDELGSVNVANGSWHHVVTTYNGTSKASGVEFYVDGNLDTAPSTVFNGLSATSISTAPLSLGSRGASLYFSGDIEDVAMYPGSLSSARIVAHHNAAAQTSAVSTSPVIYNTAYPEAIYNDTPVSYWRLAETSGTTATDSWGSNTGTYNSVTLGRTGGIPGDSSTAASFNGTSSYVSLPSGLVAGTGFVYTIEARFNTVVDGPIFAAQDQSVGSPNAVDSYDPMLYVGTDGRLHGGMYAAKNLSSTEIVNNGTWHEAALTEDSQGNVTLYLDGRQVATQSGAIRQNIPYDQIGAGYANGWIDAPSGWWYFNGQLSDVSFYNQALSGSQLALHAGAALAPYPTAVAADSPVSYWRLSDTTAYYAFDSSGANQGTFEGGVSMNQPSGLSGDPSTSTGFNGTNAYVNLPAGLITATGQVFSIEARFKTTSDGPIFGGQDQPVGGSSVVSYDPTLYVGTDGKLHGGMYQATGLVSTQSVNDGGWHDAVLTEDSQGNVTMYLDGKGVSSGTGAVAQNLPYDQIGAGWANGWPAAPNGWWYFNGDISDVSLYGGPLSASQVLAHYVATSAAPASPNEVHHVEVQDQQFIAGGHMNFTSSVGGFDPDYGLLTQSTDPDGKMTQTSYSASGIGPELGLPTAVTEDPGGLNLTTTTTYEAPGPGSYLRVIAKTLPAGNQTTYSNYAGTATPLVDPATNAPPCGVPAGTYQAGLLEQETDPAPATGSGDARMQQYVYDAEGRQVGVRTGTSNTIDSAEWACTYYDSAGRIVKQSWPAFNNQPSRTVTYTYSVGGNPLVNSVTDTNWSGKSISSTVDLLDRVVSYSDIWGNTTTTSYDQVGRQTGTSGPMGPMTQNYDPATGRQTTTTDYGANLASAEWNTSTGQLAGVSYLNGTSLQELYDQKGRQAGEAIFDKQGTSGERDTLSPAGRVSSSTTDVGQDYTTISPTRIADTRSGSGEPYAGKTLGPNSTLNIQVTGANGDGIPQDATGVVLNVTAADATASSFLTVYPAGGTQPTTANLVFSPASLPTNNQVTAALGDGGQISIYNSAGSTDVTVDVMGYYLTPAGGSGYQAVPTETRICDTRAGSGISANQCNHNGSSSGTLQPNTSTKIQVSGLAGVPSGASAAVVDLSVVNDTTGYLAAYADGSPQPSTANLDYTTGSLITKEVVAPLGADGAFDVFNGAGTTDLIVDVEGYFTPGSQNEYFPTSPTRIADTRSGSGEPYAGQTLAPGATLTVQVAGANADQVPNSAVAAVLNVTEADSTSSGYLTAYPANTTRPGTSSLLFNSGVISQNEVTVGLNGGAINIYNSSGNTDVVVDVMGFYNPVSSAATSSYTYDGAGRLTAASLPGASYDYSYGATSGCPANSAGANTNRTTLTVTGNGAGTTNYCYDNADRLVSDTSAPSGSILYDAHGNTTQLGDQYLDYDPSDQLVRSDTPTNVTLYKRDPLNRIAQRTEITPITEIATTNASATGTSLTLNRPAGTRAGDLIVASLSASVTGTLSASGWTVAATQTAGASQTWVLYRYATSSDPSSWTLSVGAVSISLVGALTTYRNTASSSSIGVTATSTNLLSTSQPLPQVTTTSDAQTIYYAVGYTGNVTPSAPSGTNQRAAVSSNQSLLVADAYQDRPGTTPSRSASSNTAAVSASLTVALVPTSTVSRLGYGGETENSGFVQNTSGSVIGYNIPLIGGVSYDLGPTGASVYSYTNLHGDTIETADSNGNRTWTGYWGPYGELASGSAPANSIMAGADYGYNGQQGKLTDGAITMMGARVYQPALGRLLTVDPVQGGCANLYTYAFGDPANHPDLSGEFSFGHLFHSIGCFISSHKAIAIGLGVLSIAAGGAGVVFDSALLAGASGLLGTAASAPDIVDCLHHDSKACAAATLGLVGGGSGLATTFKNSRVLEELALESGLGGLAIDVAPRSPTFTQKSKC